LKIGRWHISRAQHVFAEDFAAFQLSGRFVGSEDFESFGFKHIDNPLTQWNLRADDGQTDIVLFGKLDQASSVGGGQIDVFAVQSGACVSRGDENAVYAGTLSHFPCNCMLATTATDYQNFHFSPNQIRPTWVSSIRRRFY